MFENIFTMLAVLLAAFATQMYLIKRLVAYIKEMTGWKGNAARGMSSGVGAILGGLMLWVFLDFNTVPLPLSATVLLAVLFIVISGLVASGDYDLKAAVDTPRVLLLKPPVITANEAAVSSSRMMAD